MREHRDLVARGEAYLATSVLTMTEVLQSSLSADAKEKLSAIEGRRNFRYIDASMGVARLAHEIRDYYYRLDDDLPTVSIPDAFHLASAIATPGCRELYTFDGKSKRKDKVNRTLIPLSGKIAGKYDLKVAAPSTADVTLLDLAGHE